MELSEKIAALKSKMEQERKRVAAVQRSVDEAQRAVDAFDRDAIDLKEEAAALDRMEQEAVRRESWKRESRGSQAAGWRGC